MGHCSCHTNWDCGKRGEGEGTSVPLPGLTVADLMAVLSRFPASCRVVIVTGDAQGYYPRSVSYEHDVDVLDGDEVIGLDTVVQIDTTG
jgi:hypothetical protein